MYKCTNCGKEFEGNFCPKCGTKAEKEFSPPPDGTATPDDTPAAMAPPSDRPSFPAPPAEVTPTIILQETQKPKIRKLRTVVKLVQAQKWISICIPLWALFITVFFSILSPILRTGFSVSFIISSLGIFTIIPAFVLLVIGLVKLYRKQIKFGKKRPVYLQKILEGGRILLIVSAFISFAVSVIATVFLGLLSKSLLASLEMNGNLEYILVSLLLVFPLGLFALCCMFNAAACLFAQKECRSLAKDQDIVPYYAASDATLAAVLNAFPVTKRARRGQQLCWLSMGLALVISLAVVFPVANTNIFRVAKLDKIPLGASQYKVAKILGAADYDGNAVWEYYSENYMSVYRRQKSIEEKYAEALLNGDLDRMEELDKQNKKLAEEAAGMAYRHIQILFDAEGLVFRVEMSYEHIPREGESAEWAHKEKVRATVLPASVPYEMLSTIQLSYRYAAEDGDSYVHALLTNPTWNKTVEGTGTYSLTWEDTRYEYSGWINIT